jgi:hypothetical protein
MIQHPLIKPKPRGRLWVAPGTVNVREMNIDIYGDPEGLEYFAELLRYVAQVDQRIACVPRGDRYRVQLEPGAELKEGSGYLDLVRADASGTGAYPEHLSLEDERPY